MTKEPIRQKLSASDVQKLMVNPSAETRVQTTGKIAGQFASGDLSPSERKIAEDIFRTLVRDTEIRVRESLAAHLKSSPDLPHDVAVSLAKGPPTAPAAAPKAQSRSKVENPKPGRKPALLKGSGFSMLSANFVAAASKSTLAASTRSRATARRLSSVSGLGESVMNT